MHNTFFFFFYYSNPDYQRWHRYNKNEICIQIVYKKLEVEQAKIPYNLFLYIWDLQVGLTPEMIIPQIYTKLYQAEGPMLPYFLYS